MMVVVISYIIAFFITVPFTATWLVYFILIKQGLTKLKAFHQAVNWTALLYIISVLLLIQLNFDMNLIGIFIIFFLAALGIIIFMQWKRGTEILLFKAIKLLWRGLFLFFAFLYICLAFFDIGSRIFY